MMQSKKGLLNLIPKTTDKFVIIITAIHEMPQRKRIKICLSIIICMAISNGVIAQNSAFSWLEPVPLDSISRVLDIAVPEGFNRTNTDSNSFGSWLRRLPLKAKDTPLKLYDNIEKWNQSDHYRIIDIDVGNADLQQCADAVIRLRAEYLYATGKYTMIHFNFTSGDTAWFRKWAEGYRPQINGDNVRWNRSASVCRDYQTFRTYLDSVFMYAGSHSLSKELDTVDDLEKIQAGDVFINGGFPGHAVIVIDVAQSSSKDQVAFLIAQSYMPAQDIHILKNPNNEDISPWYIVNDGDCLDTPSWVFDWSSLRRFESR